MIGQAEPDFKGIGFDTMVLTIEGMGIVIIAILIVGLAPEVAGIQVQTPVLAQVYLHGGIDNK